MISEQFFGVCYQLSPNTGKEEQEQEPPKKKVRSKIQYRDYCEVIPSTKTIMKMKHLLAIQQERNTALALLDTVPSDPVTLHYDTTKRKHLNGEWPSIVLQTSSGKKYRLRSLNMANEDRRNIVNLLVASLSRLSIASSSKKKHLWEKITALMTDSVSKNLEIENLIAATLLSDHIPLHLLCVSHTCEVFDSGNLAVLRQVELRLGIHDKIVKVMPFLKSFISKGLIQAVIEAIGKLISNDGHSTSLYAEFEQVLNKVGKPKKLALYKERRFGLLGYSAAALLHHICDITETLSDTGASNQLVQACRLYLDIPYIEIALRCVAWFTYKVTLPFLNMCELENPHKLLELLPKLHDDLKRANMDTLKNYQVDYSFDLVEPVTNLEKFILEHFCMQGASDIQRQRGREFGFSKEGEKPRCTDLTTVDNVQLSKLPTHNLICERDLSRMDKIAIHAASCSNRNATGRSMRDDMTLYQTHVVSVEKETREIAKLLDEHEKQWFISQEDIMKQKLKENKESAAKKETRVNTIISICKSHGGPFTTVKELNIAMKSTDDEKEKRTLLRNEILLRKDISQKDSKENPELYKVNSMTIAQMKINLGILLSGGHDNDNVDEKTVLPDIQNMFLELNHSNDELPPTDSNETDDMPLNELCVAIWDTGNEREWFIGMRKEKVSTEEYIIDYLEPLPNDKGRKMWRYPSKVDQQKTLKMQMVLCNVIGAWDLTKRKPVFVLHNNDVIDELVKALY